LHEAVAELRARLYRLEPASAQALRGVA
jgi:hypothetical protein